MAKTSGDLSHSETLSELHSELHRDLDGLVNSMRSIADRLYESRTLLDAVRSHVHDLEVEASRKA